MLKDFNELSDEARLWIYQANRELSQDEVSFVEGKLKPFLTAWKSHGEPLSASMKIVHKQFIIVAVDQAFQEASGCSIDASVHEIKAIDEQLGADLFNKLNLAYLKDDQVQTLTIPQFKLAISTGDIHKNTLIFNNMISVKRDLISNWCIPAKDSWVGKYFKKEAIR